MGYQPLLLGNVILADKVRKVTDLFSRSKGLRFSRRLKQGEAIILESPVEGVFETTIDMFFVFFPLDILWLDTDKRVVDKAENVKPFTPFLTPARPAKYVVELPRFMGRLVKVGDSLSF